MFIPIVLSPGQSHLWPWDLHQHGWITTSRVACLDFSSFVELWYTVIADVCEDQNNVKVFIMLQDDPGIQYFLVSQPSQSAIQN